MSADERPEDERGDAFTRLRDLPVHSGTDEHDRRTHAAAREAFGRRFENAQGKHDLFAAAGPLVVGRGGVAVRAAFSFGLVAVIALYLFWAFALAITLNQ